MSGVKSANAIVSPAFKRTPFAGISRETTNQGPGEIPTLSERMVDVEVSETIRDFLQITLNTRVETSELLKLSAIT
jgi:hypothetical protein